MKVENLKEIYKDGIIENYPHADEAYFSYFDGVKYLHLLKGSLKPEEITLLKSLMDENNYHSEWHDFLIKGVTSIPNNQESIQCIHFHVKKVKNNQEQWLLNFQSYFPNLLDGFFLNEENGILILNKFQKSPEELQGFISMLDDDFSTATTLFIGSRSNKDSSRLIFQEEQKLFQSTFKTGKVIDFIDVYIPYYIAPQLKESIVANEIRKTMANDPELISLVQSLWKHQGNLSATADDLFIHRNTINYRMEKLKNDHGLNLRNTPELLLSYLLTI